MLRKVKLLDSLKEAGNEAFKANKFTEAIDKYSEALVVDPENESFNATVLSNRAAAFLKVSIPQISPFCA